MKGVISSIRGSQFVSMTAAVVAGTFLVVSLVNASTTISTDITTGGSVYASSTLAVTGAATFFSPITGALAASSTFQVTGNQTDYGTLTVVGKTTMGNASSTLLSNSGVSWLNGATTVGGALTYGGVTLTNAVTGTGSMVLSASPTFTGTVVTAAASSSSLKVGTGTESTLNSLIFGFCTANVSVTASSTAFADCTGAGQVTTGDYVFVMATSSLPTRIILQAASSTATAGTIQLQLFNTGINGGDSGALVASFNYLAIH